MKPEASHLLREVDGGSREAINQLFDMVYQDLRARAEVMLRSERVGHTLQPTALVHEAYLRLVDQRNTTWKSRAHFCATAAMAMRRILVDYARKKNTARRGGPSATGSNLAPTRLSVTDPDDILFAHELIEELRGEDETQAKIVELRFFGELSVEEVAEALGCSKRAVEAEWTMIRALIRSRLGSRRS